MLNRYRDTSACAYNTMTSHITRTHPHARTGLLEGDVIVKLGDTTGKGYTTVSDSAVPVIAGNQDKREYSSCAPRYSKV